VSARLPAVNPRKLIRVLEGEGWQLDRIKGSHHVFRHPESPNRVVVPVHRRDLAPGTLNTILKGAGITREELLKRLK